MSGKGLAALLLVALLLSPEPLQLLAPSFVAEVEAAYSSSGCESGRCQASFAAQEESSFGFRVLFRECYGRHALVPGFPNTFSGSSAHFSSDGKYAYVAAMDGVHVIDLERGREAAAAKIRGATFCGNNPITAFLYNLAPEQLAEGPNGTVVAAPHSSNPFIVHPNGTKREVPVYSKNELGNLYSYHIASEEGRDYFWGNSKGIAAFNIDGQVHWKKDYEKEGGVTQVSVKNTVAAVTKAGELKLLDKRTGSEIKVVKGVRAVAAGGSHYVALDEGNRTPIAFLYDDGTMTEPIYTIEDVIVRMASGVSKSVTSLFALSSTRLYILFIVNATRVVDVWSHEVKARSIVVKTDSTADAVLFTAIGEETLVGRVDGVQVTILGYKKNDRLANAGDVMFAKLTEYKDENDTTVLARQPFNGSVLLVEVFEAGACAQISLLNPKPLKPGPHVEVRGKASSSVMLEPGSTVSVSFTPFTPLRVVVELESVTKQRQVVSLIQRDRSGYPSVTPMYVDSEAPLFWILSAGRTQSFWNLSLLQSGGLEANYKFRAVVYASPLGASKSVPLSSMAIFWYRLMPTRIDAYDQILVTAHVTSTSVTPQDLWWIETFKTVEYGTGLVLTLITTNGLLKSFAAYLKTAPEGVGKLVEVVSQPTGEAAKKNQGLFQRILNGVKSKMEAFVGDAAQVEVRATGKVAGADKVLEAATKQGVSVDQAGAALKTATQEAFQSKVNAALQGISPRERVNAYLQSISEFLKGLQEEASAAGTVKVTIGDETFVLSRDQVATLQRALYNSIVKSAEAVSSNVAPEYKLPAFQGKTVAEAIDYIYRTAYECLTKIKGVAAAEAATRAEQAVKVALQNSVVEALTEVSLYSETILSEESLGSLGAWLLGVVPTLGIVALASKRVEAAVPTPEEVAAHLKAVLIEQGVQQSKAQAVADALASFGKVTWVPEGVNVRISTWPNFASVVVTAGVPIGLKIIKGVAGSATLFGVTVNFVALNALIALSFYYLVQFTVSSFTALGIGHGNVGATVVRGIAFSVKLPTGKRGMLVAVEPLPQLTLSALNAKTLREEFLRALEESKRNFGVDTLKVVETSTFDIDWKATLMKAFGGDAVLEEAGPAVFPTFWAMPSYTSDTSTEWIGRVNVLTFDIAGVNERIVELTGSAAALPPDVWKQLKVTAYGEGGRELGDFVPFSVEENGRRAVFLAPTCLYDVRRIALTPGPAWSGKVDATVTLEGAIIADASPADPEGRTYRADASWESGLEFETVATAIYGFDRVHTVQSQLTADRVLWFNYSEVQRHWDEATKTLFVPGKALTGDVGKSWFATFWIYTVEPKRPRQEPEPQPQPEPEPPIPHPKPVPDDRREDVQPSPRWPTIPPAFEVREGEVLISLYLNGTFPFGTLPTLLSVYLYTRDKGRVWFSVNYTISVEEGSTWKHVETGNIINGTVRMPGNYSRVFNARIAHLIEKAAILAAQHGTPAIVAFYGYAKRLDTNKTCSAYSAVPVLPGHLPVQPSSSVTVRVYDAVTFNPIEGANVTLSGPIRYSALTNSTGYAFFASVRNGTYTLRASANGYKAFETPVTVARDLMLNVPLVPESARNMSALLVKVRTIDGLPLKGAAVYVNGSLVGETDSYGEWGALYPWGSKLNVTVSYGGWSAQQTVEMRYSRVLVVFEYPGESQYFRPQVSAIFVKTIDQKVKLGRSAVVMAAVAVNSNNSYTAEVGFKKGGRVVSKTAVARNPSRSMLDIFYVEVNVTETGALVPYLNVTWARADSDPRDNYAEGEAVKAAQIVHVAFSIGFDVEEWAFGVPGLILPGETVFRVNVTVWVKGPAARMVKPVKLKALFKHKLLTAYEQPLGSVEVGELKNATLLSVLVECPYARYVSPVLQVVDWGSAADEYELVAIAPEEGMGVELPPHVIVWKTAEVVQPAVKVGDKVTVKVRVWTNLVKPGEGRNVKLYFHVGRLENESFKFTAWSDVFDLRPGEQVVETVVPFPRDYRMEWYEVYKEEEGKFFLGSVEDSWGADNWATARIKLFNTSTVLFWVLAGLAAIFLLLLLLTLVRGGQAARAAQAIAEASEWLEESGGREGGEEGSGWLEALKPGFRSPARFKRF